MARLRAFSQFNYSDINLNDILANEVDSEFENNIFVKVFGDVYEDAITVEWLDDGELLASSFGGTGFTENSNGNITGGTVTGYLEQRVVGNTDIPLLAISDFSVSAVDVYKALVSRRTKDDYDILESIFGEDDAFDLSNQADVARGLNGDDIMLGKDGRDRLYGGDGDDELYGGNKNDRLFGGNDDDKLFGGNGADRLYGGRNDDILKGGKGNDILRGEGGRDKMFGGGGGDVFEFRNTSESRNKRLSADRIEDFAQGKDLIDVSKIDASTILGGNDAFVFNGTARFTTSDEGEIYYRQFDNAGTKRDYTMVYFSTDDDRGTEMAIRLTGLVDVTADDFVL